MPTAGSEYGWLSHTGGYRLPCRPAMDRAQTGVHTHAHGLFQSPQAAR